METKNRYEVNESPIKILSSIYSEIFLKTEENHWSTTKKIRRGRKLVPLSRSIFPVT